MRTARFLLSEVFEFTQDCLLLLKTARHQLQDISCTKHVNYSHGSVLKIPPASSRLGANTHPSTDSFHQAKESPM